MHLTVIRVFAGRGMSVLGVMTGMVMDVLFIMGSMLVDVKGPQQYEGYQYSNEDSDSR